MVEINNVAYVIGIEHFCSNINVKFQELGYLWPNMGGHFHPDLEFSISWLWIVKNVLNLGTTKF